jgi:hypothetical protein
MKTHVIAIITVTVGLSALAKADSTEVQTIGSTGPTSNLGLTPFNTTLGTLDFVSIDFNGTGSVADGDSGTITFDILSYSFSAVVDACPTTSCPLILGIDIPHDNTPADLTAFESTFTNSFSSTSAVTSPSISGTLTYNYTPAVAAVPEPASWGLLLTLIGMGLIVRKRSATR